MLMSMISAPASVAISRARRHPFRLAASQLNRMNAGSLTLQPQPGLGPAADQRGTGGHLRYNEPGSEF